MSLLSNVQEKFAATTRSQLNYLQARMESQDDFRERALRIEEQRQKQEQMNRLMELRAKAYGSGSGKS